VKKNFYFLDKLLTWCYTEKDAEFAVAILFLQK